MDASTKLNAVAAAIDAESKCQAAVLAREAMQVLTDCVEHTITNTQSTRKQYDIVRRARALDILEDVVIELRHLRNTCTPLGGPLVASLRIVSP